MTNEAFINYVESHYDYNDLVELNEEELEKWHQTAEDDFISNNKSTVALDNVTDIKRDIVQTKNELYYNDIRNQISSANYVNELPQIDNNYSSDTVNRLNIAYQNRSDFIAERLEPRREEAFNLSYDNTPYQFRESIRSGRITDSFNKFYGLGDEEGEFIQSRLNQEYLQEQIG